MRDADVAQLTGVEAGKMAREAQSRVLVFSGEGLRRFDALARY